MCWGVGSSNFDQSFICNSPPTAWYQLITTHLSPSGSPHTENCVLRTHCSALVDKQLLINIRELKVEITNW